MSDHLENILRAVSKFWRIREGEIYALRKTGMTREGHVMCPLITRAPLHLARSFLSRRNWKLLEVYRGTLRAVRRVGVRLSGVYAPQLCD